MFNFLTNPIISHLIVAALASGGAWWAAVKTKAASLETEARAKVDALIADARAEFTALQKKL